jgi:branched-chain amino acid transport system substrate-binding protein
MITRQDLIRAGTALAATIALPRHASAAGGPVVVRIGFIDSFSGVFSDLGGYHKLGATIALDEANAKTSRVRYEVVLGDDASRPAEGSLELRRLVEQEKVDVLFGGTSSAVGLANSALAESLGIFNMSLGPQDSSITGEKANATTFRFGPNVRMLLGALSRRILALGKKWYFIQADYAYGKDAYAQLSALLRRSGGTEVGVDVLKLGTVDFSAALTKVRNSDADVLVLANSGLDAANTIKQFVDFGLNKRLKLAGINIEDIYYKAIPLDPVAGSTFPVVWSPTVSPSARALAQRLRRLISGVPVSWRHYMGYMAMRQLIEGMNAAGTTKADRLVAAFSDRSFDAAKTSRSTFRACDHQCIQDCYAGAIVGRKTFERTQFMFDVVTEVPAAESDGTCNSPWTVAAKAAIAAEKIPERDGYSPRTF